MIWEGKFSERHVMDLIGKAHMQGQYDAQHDDNPNPDFKKADKYTNNVMASMRPLPKWEDGKL